MSHPRLPITKVPQFFPSLPDFMSSTVYHYRLQTFCPSFLNWKAPLAVQHEILFHVQTRPQIISNRTFASPVAKCREDLIFSKITKCHLPWGKEWIFYSSWQNTLSAIHGCMLDPLSCPSLSDPMDGSPPGSSVHEGFPGKKTGVGCLALLQAIFPTQG